MSVFQRLYEITEARRKGNLETAKKSAEEAVCDYKRFDERVSERDLIAKERIKLEDQLKQLKYDSGWLKKIEQIANDREEMFEILRDFIDHEPEPCRLDHHGYCQEHGWLAENACPVARAKRVVERIMTQNESRPGD